MNSLKDLVAPGVNKACLALLVGEGPDGAPAFVQLGADGHVVVKSGGAAVAPVIGRVSEADLSGGAVDLTAAPDAGKTIVADQILVSSAAALSVTIQEEGGTVLAVLHLGENTTAPPFMLRASQADEKLQVLASGAGQVDVTVIYHSE